LEAPGAEVFFPGGVFFPFVGAIKNVHFYELDC